MRWPVFHRSPRAPEGSLRDLRPRALPPSGAREARCGSCSAALPTCIPRNSSSPAARSLPRAGASRRFRPGVLESFLVDIVIKVEVIYGKEPSEAFDPDATADIGSCG